MLRPVLGDIVAAARVLSALPDDARAARLEAWIGAARQARRARARGVHGRNGTLMAEALAEDRGETQGRTLDYRALTLVAGRFGGVLRGRGADWGR